MRAILGILALIWVIGVSVIQAADPIKVISFYLPPGVESEDANSYSTLPVSVTDAGGNHTLGTKPS